jgi:hypothetical protein
MWFLLGKSTSVRQALPTIKAGGNTSSSIDYCINCSEEKGGWCVLPERKRMNRSVILFVKKNYNSVFDR